MTNATFNFVPRFGIKVPEIKEPARAATNAHPFVGILNDAEATMAEGREFTLFVPSSYWLSRPNVEAANVKPGWEKAKLRDEFKKWQKETEETPAVFDQKTKKLTTPAVNPNRGNYVFSAFARTGNETGDDIWAEGQKHEPGVSFWVVLNDEGRKLAAAAAEKALKDAEKAAKKSAKTA